MSIPEERCPHRQQRIPLYGGIDMCELVDKWCLLDGGLKCEVYEKFLAKLQEDADPD